MDALIVSTALDTNGQNFRYAQASERWGSDPTVLKALIAGIYDPADVAGRFRRAADKLGTLAIRTAHTSEAYFDFPRDIRWTSSSQTQVKELADEADIIHLNNDVKAYFKLMQARRRKPALLHHHGTLFRNQPDRLLIEAHRFHMVQAVSTIDLQRVAPHELHWLPTAYDLEAMAEIGRENRTEHDGILVVSAPTNREIKSTGALIAAVAALQAEGLKVELELIEGRTWAECLVRKASADIYFDQVGLGYGCNAIEAWGMGIPVVAGADEWTLGQMRKEWNLGPRQKLPFYEATEETIVDALRALVKSKDLRAKYAALGAAHNAKYHAEKPALARLAELYGLAIRTKEASASEPLPDEVPFTPGRFRTEHSPALSVRLASHTVHFVDFEAQVDDPRLAQKLRRLSQFDRSYKITEIVDDRRSA
jgi:hypothetical protein